MTDGFLQRIHDSIVTHKMIEAGETVLVAVSGGADSLALLHCLHSLRPHLKCQFHVAHFNHALRPEADADAAFVRHHAVHLKLPVTISRKKCPPTEAGARKARYQFYEDVCTRTQATKVALGHHQDDTAETVLMHLIRGTGAAGLKGIAPVRDGKFIRPLTGVTRQQIESFLTAKGITPRHDPTNTDTRYLRNRVRHELIPTLETDYNPNIKSGLNRTATVLSAESEYLETVAQEALRTCRLQSPAKSIVVDSAKFRALHIALQRRVLRHLCSDLLGHTENLYFNHYDALLSSIHGDTPNLVLALPNRLQFRRTYQTFTLEVLETEDTTYLDLDKVESFAYPIAVPGETTIAALNARIIAKLETTPPHERFTLPNGKCEAVIDYQKLTRTLRGRSPKTLTLRNRRQGDRFRPHGMQGTKKIKDFFIDAKVPRLQRDRIPMVVSGDVILWIIGYTTNEAYKVHRSTQQYLYLRYVTHETMS